MSTSLRRLLAVLGLVLLLFVAGCGGDSDDSSDSSSADTSEESNDDSADSGDSGDRDELIKAISSSIDKYPSAHLEMTMGTSTSEADVQYGENPAMRMTIKMEGQEVTMLLVDNTLYMGPINGKYLKIDADQPGAGEMFDQFKSLTPEETVKAMEEAVQSVEDKGETKVDGVDVRRYLVTLKAAGESGAPTSYELYVDDEGRMRQMEMGEGAQKVVVKMSKWGEPVNIKAPDPSQVTELPSR